MSAHAAPGPARPGGGRRPGLRGTGRAVAVVAGLALLAALLVALWPGTAQKTAVAYFPRAIHIYPGSEVDVLGVRIGTVSSVTPVGTDVRVVLRYAASRRIPADATAVILEPTLVADRVVQLTPPYTGGPVLADGAVLPPSRTAIPVELDALTKNLSQLAAALGPDGANAQGALSRLLTVGAANLRGQGGAANTTIRRVSELMSTLGDNRDALFATVRNLQVFTTALAQHDGDTRAFAVNLDLVAQELDAERASFGAALSNLGTALGNVATFVRANRQAVSSDVATLASVTNVLAKERILLAHIVDIGAVGIGNYPHMYTPSVQTYNARFDNNQTDNPALFVCQLYQSVGGSPTQCLQYLAPLKNVPIPGGAR